MGAPRQGSKTTTVRLSAPLIAKCECGAPYPKELNIVIDAGHPLVERATLNLKCHRCKFTYLVNLVRG